MKKIVSALLLGTIFVSFSACGAQNSANLMDGIEKTVKTPSLESQEDTSRLAVADFGVRLFSSAAIDGKNTLISPLSVISALSMTANGADSDTLREMEAVIGLDTASLNEYMAAYLSALPDTDKCKLSLANSIWFTDDKRFSVNEDFLGTNANYYGADIFKSPFDSSTVRDINTWVKDRTDGMIKDVLDKIPDTAVMYLVNALAFDAEWQSIYKDYQVRNGKFTREDGKTENVKLMYSSEGRYIEDENAVGFIKYYSKNKYAFAAILPDEGVSVSDYIASLDGEKLLALIDGATQTSVNAAIPKFNYDYATELSAVLSEMGMPTAFDPYNADFSALGTSSAGNIFISSVIHKTHIEVGERGTRAGAATVVVMEDGAAEFIEKPKEVILDRPFIYAIIDCEAGLPVFIGSVMEIG